MSEQLFVKLLREFNRGSAINERSLIKELTMTTQIDLILSKKINDNLHYIKTYKGLLLVLGAKDKIQLQKTKIVIKRIQDQFIDRALYGFNLNNELFIKFLQLVKEKQEWDDHFSQWLDQYIAKFHHRMTLHYSMNLLKVIGNSKYLEQHISDIKRLRDQVICNI